MKQTSNSTPFGNIETHGILNRDEISFLLQPTSQNGTISLIVAQLAATPDFIDLTDRLAKLYAQKLQKLLYQKVSAHINICPITDDSAASTDLDFEIVTLDQKENIVCRLSYDDANKLTTTALGTHGCRLSCRPSGISLNILHRCLHLLADAIHQVFPDLVTIPQKPVAILSPIPTDHSRQITMLLQLDICGRTIKLNLILNIKTLLKFRRQAIGRFFSAAATSGLPATSLRNVRICLTAQTTPIALPLSQAAHWQRGTFIPLKMKPDEPVELSAVGIPPIKALIGRKGSRIAVKLTTKVKTHDKL